MPRRPTARAPSHLQPATRRWWAGVLADYELEQHHVRLLTLAGEAWDDAQAAREEIARDGATYRDRFDAPRAHPAVARARDARLAFARLLRELDLDAETAPDPRMPRRGGR